MALDEFNSIPVKKKPPANGKKTELPAKPAKNHQPSATNGKGAPHPPPVEPASRTDPLTEADRMAAKQREISVSEFFLKNRHLLGFDNAKKALLTTIKEAVDNSLDACEEAKILPDVFIEVKQLQEDRFAVVVEDNGPGVVREQIPKIFGKLLYGSKFHSMKQSRGQQGIGISAAGMYGQLTTGVSTKITSRISAKKPAHYFEIQIDTNRNVPTILKDEVVEWDRPHGTRVEIELEAKYQKGRHSVEDYVRQTVIANPHVTLTNISPMGEKEEYKPASRQLPMAPREIKPHPHGVELGILMKMLKSTTSRKIKAFLSRDFARVSSRVAGAILKAAEISETARPKAIAHAEADKLYRAINATKLMKPPTDCLSPIGEGALLQGIKKNVEADFYTAVTRPPSVYRGNPFQIEVALAYGGKLPAEELVDLMRFANRVPLLYQQSACAITKSVLQTSWKNYGVEQSKGALPGGPLLIAVHMASVWVPFTSESKEAIASYPEIIHEIKLGLQECGRRLDAFIRKGRREAEALRKKDYIRSYLPHIGIGLREILRFKQTDEQKVLGLLTDILEKSRV
ncbi:MAG: DNA topoisomerase VI subunit B [Verrucomicrobia bacterium]|nr:DNA topoisomerase VI subunit B [Verrucomicrobiota bacterium]